MKRKEFIKKTAGSIAALTVINLLKLEAKNHIKSDAERWTFYRKFQEAKGTKIIIRKFYFNVHKTLENNTLNTIYLKVETYDKGDKEKLTMQTANYEITVKNIKPVETGSGYEYYLSCGKYKKIEGPDLLFECEFEPLQSKKSDVRISTNKESAKMEIFRKGNWLMTLDEFDPNADDKDDACYLTTLCVNHLNKNDNCYELETLRKFRDEYVLQSSEGKRLVNSYYSNAPSIVSRLNKAKNKSKILDAMYTDLVLPTLKLIEENKLQEAKEYYTNYALMLHQHI